MKRDVAKQIQNANSIAAIQACPTSPRGYVMDGDEYVMVALAHPWRRKSPPRKQRAYYR
jgi:hypothetical protein